MQRVTVNGSVEQELRRAAVVAEVCDSSGRVIGYFRPRQVPQHLLDLVDVPMEQLLERGRLRRFWPPRIARSYPQLLGASTKSSVTLRGHLARHDTERQTTSNCVSASSLRWPCGTRCLKPIVLW
ncbi:MAG: hypothetical protein ACKO40_01950 [Planctomycetaceae bacterium]